MKVDRTLFQEQIGLRSDAKTGSSFVDSLETGDRIEALVLSGDGQRHVMMKTDSGYIVKALVGEGLDLSPGVKVRLVVSGRQDGVVSLSIIDSDEITGNLQDGADGKIGRASKFSDKNLALCANKLEELNIPADVKTARAMQELIERNPSIKLDEAAFLVSNGLSGDDNMVRSTLAYLSGGEKMDAIVAHLFELMDLPEQVDWGDPNLDVDDGRSIHKTEDDAMQNDAARSVPVMETDTEYIDSLSPNESQHRVKFDGFSSTPLSDWLVRLDAGVEDADTDADYNVERSAERHEADVPKNNAQGSEIIQNTYIKEAGNTEKSIASSRIDNQTQARREPSGRDEIASTPTGRVIVELLSELPEFSNTPTPTLERFSKMLLRIAGDSAKTLNGDEGNLAALLDKLFINIKRNSKDSGLRLKNAREELFTRLALIEEEISRCAAPLPKQAMLEQTRRLLDNARLFSNMDQFAYAQIPVIMGEARKTAELYVFKRKDIKRADPENINILLALELENMGHWEALISFRNKDVSIQMDVRAEEEKEYFSENSVLLHEMLMEAGFKLVNLDIKHKQKETTPLTALVSLNNYLSERKGMIDFAI